MQFSTSDETKLLSAGTVLELNVSTDFVNQAAASSNLKLTLLKSNQAVLIHDQKFKTKT